MSSFSPAILEHLVLPPRLIRTIRQIGEFKGRQDLYRLQAPEKLENLRQVAIIQSVESSNRIEGVTAPPERLRALLEEKTTPQNHSEAEIAGYRDVLATIHASAADIPFTGCAATAPRFDAVQQRGRNLEDNPEHHRGNQGGRLALRALYSHCTPPNR